MVWLTLRRHRLALVVFGAAAVALTVWMIVVHHDYVAAAHGHKSCDPLCGEPSAKGQADTIFTILLLLPGVLGLVLGTPLISGELENRTAVFALTQSVSRIRWVVTRWAVVGLAVTVLAAALGAMAYWFFTFPPSFDTSRFVRIEPGAFDVTGLVPVAYALFAFSLGAALGALFRRTAFAILGTLAAFITARLAVLLGVRPYLAGRGFLVYPNYNPSLFTPTGRWYIGLRTMRVVPGSGHPSTWAYINHVTSRCSKPFQAQPAQPPTATSYTRYFRCLGNHGVQMGQWFQPSSHYWALQLGEAGVFVAGALALLGVSVWSVRRWSA